jgi:hypothetical protein
LLGRLGFFRIGAVGAVGPAKLFKFGGEARAGHGVVFAGLACFPISDLTAQKSLDVRYTRCHAPEIDPLTLRSGCGKSGAAHRFAYDEAGMTNRIYKNPFIDRQQVEFLERRYIEDSRHKDKISDEVAFAAGKCIRNNSNVGESLGKIFQWKLQTFRKRFRWVTAFPQGICDERIERTISVVLNALEYGDVCKAINEFDNFGGLVYLLLQPF